MDLETVALVKMIVSAGLAYLSLRKIMQIQKEK